MDSSKVHRLAQRLDPKKPLLLSSTITLPLDLLVGSIRSVAPLSALLIAFRTWAYLTGRRQSLLFSRTSLFRRILNVWLVLEAAFFVYCRVVQNNAQAQPPEHRVVRLTKAERLDLFERCLQTSESAAGFCESWYRTNHTFDELKRDNVKEWLAWGMFHKHDVLKDMDQEELGELEELTCAFESRCKPGQPEYKIPLGRTEDALLMKFSEEPVVHTHRPLVMYTAVHFVLQEMIAPFRMSRLGFFRGTENSLAYLHRIGHLPEKHPLVFIHGLGVGILPYEGYLRRMLRATDDPTSSLFGRSILCLELHAVSQRIAPAELHRDTFVTDVRSIFTKLGYQRGGIICGHSYGSFAVTWLVKCAPDLCVAVCLLDPACMFLHLPSVLYSILYKSPTNAYERFLHFIIREELFFNAHARRHFYWYANVLFLEDIDTVTKPTMVVLSEDDPIVPVRPVNGYVKRYNEGHRLVGGKDVMSSNLGKVDLIWLDTCDHGGFLWIERHGEAVLRGMERVAAQLPSKVVVLA